MAKACIKFALTIGFIIATVIMIIFIGFSGMLSFIYSNDEELNDMSTNVHIIMGPCYFLLTLYFVFMGVL